MKQQEERGYMKNHEEDCPCHVCELEREDKERMELEESNERDTLD